MKKLLAALLAVILLTQAVPLTVLAAEEGETAPKSAEKIIRMGERRGREIGSIQQIKRRMRERVIPGGL